MTSRTSMAARAAAAAPPRRQSNLGSSEAGVMASAYDCLHADERAISADAADRAAGGFEHAEDFLDLFRRMERAERAAEQGHALRRGGRPREIDVKPFAQER